MLSLVPKHDLIKKYLNGSLYGYLLKHGFIKKGDTFTYGELLKITIEDLHHHFEQFGYPGLQNDIHHTPRSSPSGAHEGDTLWTLNEEGYTVWYVERGIPTPEFTSHSKEAFEKYWKKSVLDEYTIKLATKHTI